MHICFLPCACSSAGNSLAVARAQLITYSVIVIRIRVEVVASPRKRRKPTLLVASLVLKRFIYIWQACYSGASLTVHGVSSENLFHLITHLFLLLFNVGTVTAGRILVAGVHVDAVYRVEVVLRPILLLRGQDSFVKELCVLASVKGVVLNISLLPSEALGVFNWLEFILFVNRIVIFVVLVIQHWIAVVNSTKAVLEVGRPDVGGMGQTSPEVVLVGVLEVLGMVHELHVISYLARMAANIKLIQIDVIIIFLLNDIDPGRRHILLLLELLLGEDSILVRG